MQRRPSSPCRLTTLTSLKWRLDRSLTPWWPPMSFNQSTAMLVHRGDLTPLHKSHQRPGDHNPHICSHHLPPLLVRAATAGAEQMKGHIDTQEQLLAEVPPAEVQ